MTPKELLYVEDALGHEQQMQQSCRDFAAELQDDELKTFVSGLVKRHRQTFDGFFGLLG